jgi:anaerobic carbon-monoxide dehydrogenase iron sulfur subunit
MAKYVIETAPEKCTGCLRCELACSELYTKAFNPSASRIQVTMQGADCTIFFRSDCNGCGLCVENCFYDVLTIKAAKDEI